MPLGETVTVINKSGKVVSTGKTLVNVFKEARAAYRERKAEIKAVRDAEMEEKRVRRMMRAVTMDDTRSQASGRSSRNPHRSKSHHHSRPTLERGYTDGVYADELPHQLRAIEEDHDADFPRQELIRRHTDMAGLEMTPRKTTRSKSEPYIDMDLAYGELPPPAPVKRMEDDEEIRDKMSKLTVLLDEANCLQHSATAMIENLQQNPDALAAVALTLAEISNLATKLAPGVLGTLKGSFPAAMALLASPQFLIAAGVGVGVTIVALGGFKIIKKMQTQNVPQLEREIPMRYPVQYPVRPQIEPAQEEPLMLDELEPPELSRIEMWRRGIADVEAESMGTNVDGEFITPEASRQLIAEGVLDADDLKSRASSRRTKSKAPKSTTSSKKSSKTSKTSKTKGSSKEKTKKKEPSGLRMLFSGRSA